MVEQFKLENGIAVEIAFSDDRQFMRVNEIAAKFNKKPNDWMRNYRTKEYMDALLEDLSARSENSRNAFTTRLDLFIMKQGGRSQGTWIHPELVVEFARWVNPRFAVWCDQIIRQILKGTHPIITAPQTLPEALRAYADEIDAREATVVQEVS